MIAIRSAIVIASSWSCVTWTKVMPTSCWIAFISSCICLRSFRSSAPSGSSRSSTRGRLTSARARATRCCWPPESWRGLRFSIPESPTRRRISVTRPRTSAPRTPHLSIFENVGFGLRRRGVRGADVRGRVTEIHRLVGLSGMEKRKPRQLSGGQQQRVALARALVNRPRVLLLDEPLGALDLKLRKQMQLELKAIQHEFGITFVHVTHDQEEAMTMADTIAVMNRGRVEQLGRPDELYERPRTAFVA